MICTRAYITFNTSMINEEGATSKILTLWMTQNVLEKLREMVISNKLHNFRMTLIKWSEKWQMPYFELMKFVA